MENALHKICNSEILENALHKIWGGPNAAGPSGNPRRQFRPIQHDWPRPPPPWRRSTWVRGRGMGRSVAIKSGNRGNLRIGIKHDIDFDLGDELERRLNPAERSWLSRFFPFFSEWVPRFSGVISSLLSYSFQSSPLVLCYSRSGGSCDLVPSASRAHFGERRRSFRAPY